MPSSSKSLTHVAVVGAGPAGLLASILLLRRNLDDNLKRQYKVTIVDPGLDYGKLDEEGLKRSRSWAIGLSAHGINALKEVPDLFESYIKPQSIRISGACVISSGRTIADIQSEPDVDDYAVDRNYICHALARYLNDHFGPESGKADDDNSLPGFLETQYHTRVLFLDRERKCIVTRKKTSAGENEETTETETEMSSLPYDLVLGCDGVRSVIRNAFLTHHRDFEMKMEGIHSIGKMVHLKRPKSLKPGVLHIIMNSLPNFTSFVLPGKDEIVDFGFGTTLDNTIPEKLMSNDPHDAEEYARENIKGVEGFDYEEFGRQWAQMEFSSISQMHCNFYHSHKMSAVMLGDAAHATVPNIGQGMNTAMADAQSLCHILDAHDDDENLEAALTEYSNERVKEGNALTDISFHTFSLRPSMQASIIIRQIVRAFLNKFLPEWLVAPEPMFMLSRGVKLSEVYNRLHKLGYLDKSRRINQDIMRKHFERKVGMIKD